MRSEVTDLKQDEITGQWDAFDGTKEEFMAQIEGVTLDQRTEPAYQSEFYITNDKVSYYCTFIQNGEMFECYSYDDGDWYCKY